MEWGDELEKKGVIDEFGRLKGIEEQQSKAADAEKPYRHVDRIAELEAALRPFAEFNTETFSDDMRAFEDDPTLTMGHFRKAREVLRKTVNT